MGGRGSSAARRGGGAGGAAFTITPNANGGVTITPNAQQNQNAATLAGGGSGISDTNSHTTYFTPADRAIVGNNNTDGYRISPRTGQRVPVGYYQTGDYANINGELRDLASGKRTSLTPQTQKVVDAMDRNMRPLNNAIDTVRWTDTSALADNLGMKGASKQQIINRLRNGDITGTKADYTSSSWDARGNAVAGIAGRNVRVDMHYAKGAMAQFSPTGKEAEMVGARNSTPRFANARIERVVAQNQRYGNRYVDALVVDCYIDK